MLGCIQPMSSPMMKRMLGFCCCAAAGILAADIAAIEANKPSQMYLAMLMGWFPPAAAREGPAAYAHLLSSTPRASASEQKSMTPQDLETSGIIARDGSEQT